MTQDLEKLLNFLVFKLWLGNVRLRIKSNIIEIHIGIVKNQNERGFTQNVDLLVESSY